MPKKRRPVDIAHTTHGHASRFKRAPEYRAYINAKQRCTNPKDPRWKNYGALGIKFRFTSFEHFVQTIGKRPSSKHSIGRILDRGNYEPGNCFWMTHKQQSIAKKNNHFLCVPKLLELKRLLQEN